MNERLGADFESRLKMWTNVKHLIVGSVIATAVAPMGLAVTLLRRRVAPNQGGSARQTTPASTMRHSTLGKPRPSGSGGTDARATVTGGGRAWLR